MLTEQTGKPSLILSLLLPQVVALSHTHCLPADRQCRLLPKVWYATLSGERCLPAKLEEKKAARVLRKQPQGTRRNQLRE